MSPTSSNSSSSSTSTVRPENLPPSMVSRLEQIISRVDEAFNEDGKVKPFVGNPKFIRDLSESNWTSFINPDIKNRMEFIEAIMHSENEITYEEGVKMADKLKIIIDSFKTLVANYDISRPKMSKNQMIIVKNITFFIKS